MKVKRILCLDVGDKRIGVALSDPLGITAQGLETYIRKDEKSDIEHIALLCAQHEVYKIVCGLPKNMNGSIGFQAEKIAAFCDLLYQKTNIDIEYMDERLSSVYVERVLIDADVSRNKRKKVIDKLAAVAILQGYLDSH